MARTRKLYKMVSDWTYIKTGNAGHAEGKPVARLSAEAEAEYQRRILSRFATNIVVSVVEAAA